MFSQPGKYKLDSDHPALRCMKCLPFHWWEKTVGHLGHCVFSCQPGNSEGLQSPQSDVEMGTLLRYNLLAVPFR